MEESSRLYTKEIHGGRGGRTGRALDPLDCLDRRYSYSGLACQDWSRDPANLPDPERYRNNYL
jgi:hypothetical protein